MRELIKGEKGKKFIFFLLSFFLIFCVCLFNITKLNSIFISTDEYGYWLSGTHFAGLDWSGTSSIIPYYSYGYGLILSILLRIFTDGTILYRAAIFLNAVFLCIGFFYLYKIGRRLFKKFSSELTILVSLVITLYAGNIFLSQYTLTEILLWMLTNVLIFYLLKIFESGGIFDFIIVSVLSVYMFTIHMRTVGITIAVLMILCFYAFIYKKNYSKIILSCAIIFALIICALLLKDYVISQMKVYENSLVNNDISNQLDKVKGLIDLSNFLELIENVLGELFYLGASTFFLFYFGMVFIIKKCILLFQKILSKQQIEGNSLVYVFLLLITCANILISSISLNGRSRVDLMIYGRYNENILSVIIFCGIVELLYLQKRFICFLGFSLFHICVCFIYFFAYGSERTAPVMMAVSAILGWIYEKGFVNLEWVVCIYTLVIAGIFVLIVGIRKRKKRLVQLITVGCLFIWFINAYQADQIAVRTDSYYEVSEIIGDLWKEADIYYVICDEDKMDSYEITSINYLQFLKPRSEIQVIDYSELDQVGKNDIILLKRNSAVPKEVIRKYELLWKGGYSILVNKNSEIKNLLLERINK